MKNVFSFLLSTTTIKIGVKKRLPEMGGGRKMNVRWINTTARLFFNITIKNKTKSNKLTETVFRSLFFLFKFDLPKNKKFKLKIFQSFPSQKQFFFDDNEWKMKFSRCFFSIFIFKATINRLDIAEDALPVGLFVHHHVFDVEKGRNSGFFPGGEKEIKNWGLVTIVTDLKCFDDFRIFIDVFEMSAEQIWNLFCLKPICKTSRKKKRKALPS